MKKIVLAGFALMASIVATAHGATLVAHYGFDDPKNLGNDDSGNGFNLSVASGYGTPEYSSDGKKGGASSFNGSTQGWITGKRIYPAGSFSFAAWVKPAGEISLVACPWGLRSGFNIYVASGRYRFLTYFAENKYSYTIGKVSPENGVWQHIVMTYEAEGEPDQDGVYTGIIRAYVDGKLVGTKKDAEYCSRSYNFLAIGRRSTAVFNGLMDEVGLYDGVLTEAEIQALAQQAVDQSSGL